MADIQRTNLPAQIADEIWAKTLEESAVMSLARRIQLPGNGLAIPVITSEPEAAWVSETNAKPVSNSAYQMKTLQPYKLAVIETVSYELTRDLPALYAELRRRLPYALAAKFDATVFGTSAPGSNFFERNLFPFSNCPESLRNTQRHFVWRFQYHFAHHQSLKY